MKQLHRDDLYGWSAFDEERNIDFHSVLWKRETGNLAIDPLPLSEHDRAHLEALGGVRWIVVTNSDHVRDAARLAQRTGAEIIGPRLEAESFPIACKDRLPAAGELIPGLEAIELAGSKTPGELALVLDRTTLVTGDLVRCHRAGRLCLLPAPKLSDAGRAVDSVRRLAALPEIDAVLVGDGWPVFRRGREALQELLGDLSG